MISLPVADRIIHKATAFHIASFCYISRAVSSTNANAESIKRFLTLLLLADAISRTTMPQKLEFITKLQWKIIWNSQWVMISFYSPFHNSNITPTTCQYLHKSFVLAKSIQAMFAHWLVVCERYLHSCSQIWAATMMMCCCWRLLAQRVRATTIPTPTIHSQPVSSPCTPDSTISSWTQHCDRTECVWVIGLMLEASNFDP